MIKSLLIKLRQKPKHVRQQVALGVATVFTSIVAIFWLTSLPNTVKSISSAVPEGANAFSSFTDKINDEIQTVKDYSASRVATTTASGTPPVTDLVSIFGTTTASSSSSIVVSTTTPPIYVREVRIATTTASASQAIIE
jgi:predicted PurR-regulated permease PerM